MSSIEIEKMARAMLREDQLKAANARDFITLYQDELRETEDRIKKHRQIIELCTGVADPQPVVNAAIVSETAPTGVLHEPVEIFQEATQEQAMKILNVLPADDYKSFKVKGKRRYRKRSEIEYDIAQALEKLRKTGKQFSGPDIERAGRIPAGTSKTEIEALVSQGKIVRLPFVGTGKYSLQKHVYAFPDWLDKNGKVKPQYAPAQEDKLMNTLLSAVATEQRFVTADEAYHLSYQLDTKVNKNLISMKILEAVSNKKLTLIKNSRNIVFYGLPEWLDSFGKPVKGVSIPGIS